MARIFMDGFETGDASLTDGVSGGAVITAGSPAGFSGSYYLNCSTANDSCSKTFTNSYSELYVAFKWMCSAVNIDSQPIVVFSDSAAASILSIIYTSISTKLIHASCGGTILATGTTRLYLSKAYLIEIYYKPLNSGGIITVKVDGVQQFSYSGDTTNGLESIRVISLGVGAGYANYDDLVVDDANWIGNTKLGIIVPDGTGTTNNWTASAGNAWDCLNEKPPSDTDYVYSNTTNQIATYAMTTIANMNTVKSIQLQGRAAYEGSPTPTKIQLGVRATGADYFATDLSPGIGFGMLSKILELNPADSAAFEQADIDALEVGIKATA